MFDDRLGEFVTSGCNAARDFFEIRRDREGAGYVVYRFNYEQTKWDEQSVEGGLDAAFDVACKPL